MKIHNRSVTGQVVAYMRDKIASGEWAVGEKLPSETQLVSKLGVSRASIRSAFQYYIGLGLIKSHQGKGTFLVDDALDSEATASSKITAEDCLDICKVLEFRQMLEPSVCRAAVARATPETLRAMKRRLTAMEKAHEAGDAARFVQADLQFHEAICEACDNPLAIKSLKRVFQENRRNHEQMNALFGDDAGIRYHTVILEAFRSGDADEAASLMNEHIQETLDRVRNML